MDASIWTALGLGIGQGIMVAYLLYECDLHGWTDRKKRPRTTASPSRVNREVEDDG